MSSLRLTLRGLARAPLFTAIAVLSLALGIGANTAIFSLLDQMLLRTLPIQKPRELVFLYHPGPTEGSTSTDEGGGPSFSYPMFRELQALQKPFTALAAARTTTASIAYNNQASHGVAHLVSGNYFEVLGVRPAIGRVFTQDDDRTPGGHPVAVLGHAYWTSRFGGDVSMLNRTMIVNGYPLTIVGVAQKGFASEKLGTTAEIFVPITMKKEMTPDWDALRKRTNYWIPLFGRLKPGVTIQQADAAMNVIYRQQLEEDIKELERPGEQFLQRYRAKRIVLKPGQYGRGGMRDEARQPLTLMMGMTVLVLLIACANVANLHLARAAARTREIAVRVAMGASRMQIIRQLLTESCVLAVGGGALGLVAAYWTIRGILAGFPPALVSGLQGFVSPALDIRVLLFCLGLSILTGVLFGLFPALQSSKADVSSALKDQAGQTTASGSANLFRKSLVTVQIGMSLLLLISAGLFAKTLVNLRQVDLGIQPDHLLTFCLVPKLSGYTDQRVSALSDQLTDRLAAIPGVKLVSTAGVPAIAGNNWSSSIIVEGFVPQGQGPSNSNLNMVGPDYFRTLGMPLIAGREFTRADNLTAPRVVVVNEAFVRHYLPNQNPIGRRMGQGVSKLDTEIVGVVKDAKYSSVRQAPPRVYYTPFHQIRRHGEFYLYLRTAIEPERIAPLIRREVAALDPQLPVRELKTMETQLDEDLFAERLMSALTTSFASLATVLAAIGLYGVLAFNVARRTREIGIRMALGAGSGQVLRLVAREVAIMLAIGVAAGVASAAAAGRLLQTFLYGLQAWDPRIYVSAVILLGLVAAAAAYIPSQRATRIDPMVALRHE